MVALLLGCLPWAEAASPPTPVAPARATGAALLASRLPRVEYRGGLFLRKIRVVTITFAGDDPALVARLERFGDTIVRSPWWRDSVEGYCATAGDCIGAGRPGLAVRLDEQLPSRVHGVDISALLRREARAGRFGAYDPESVYVVYLPAGVTLFDAYQEHYCAGGPRAFHRALRDGERLNGFSVIPRCGDESELTGTASHELVELATNPDTQQRGFAFEQSSNQLAFLAAGVEPMDPCGLLTRDSHRLQESGFTVQGAWSNRAAALGQDPCAPLPAPQAYVAGIPRAPSLRLRQVGDRATVVLDATADRPGVEWQLSVVDLSGEQEGVRYVEAALEKSTVTAGESVTLTLELRRRHPQETVVVAILSTLGDQTRMWPLAVNTR